MPRSETGGGDAPGVQRFIHATDLPPLNVSRSSSNSPNVVARPSAAALHVPPGFSVSLFTYELQGPRALRTAPNRDVFVAETAAGRIRVVPAHPARAGESTVFATGLRGPFGMAFYPPGPNPRWIYIALNNQVVRYPYQPGAAPARGAAETVVGQVSATSGGHSTCDVAFSADGARMFVSVGSGSNVAEAIGRSPPGGLEAWRAYAPLGAA